MEARGFTSEGMDDETVLGLVTAMGEAFRDNAPMSAAEAATVILDGVRAGEWRILVGEDAKRLDERVRSDPWSVYGPEGVGIGTITGAG
jgi:hypothetical protein